MYCKLVQAPRYQSPWPLYNPLNAMSALEILGTPFILTTCLRPTPCLLPGRCLFFMTSTDEESSAVSCTV